MNSGLDWIDSLRRLKKPPGGGGIQPPGAVGRLWNTRRVRRIDIGRLSLSEDTPQSPRQNWSLASPDVCQIGKLNLVHSRGLALVNAVKTFAFAAVNPARILNGHRINIGPQVVARNAVEFLGFQHILVGDLPNLQHSNDCGLAAAKAIRQFDLGASAIEAKRQGFETGQIMCHAD
jgi:hypothetical protein